MKCVETVNNGKRFGKFIFWVLFARAAIYLYLDWNLIYTRHKVNLFVRIAYSYARLFTLAKSKVEIKFSSNSGTASLQDHNHGNLKIKNKQTTKC